MTAEGGLIIPGQRLRDAAGLTKWLQVFLSCWIGIALAALALHYAVLRFFENVQQGAYSSRPAALQDALVLDRFVIPGRWPACHLGHNGNSVLNVGPSR